MWPTILTLLFGTSLYAALPNGVRFLPGAVNGLLVDGKVVVYGDAGGRLKNVRTVLFTEARRDVAWAGAQMVAAGAEGIVPERERALFENTATFWADYETKRFHDYSQVNTKVLRTPVRVTRAVHGGETLEFDGVRVEVIDTPGYTPGAVSYWFEIGGKRIACTGDLIYGDGQLFDLSSLQDAIPETKTRGYHGYAARAGDLIESLQKIAARKPDIIVPARGPLIEDPQAAINRLIERLQTLMASHFATDALRWYWGDESLRIRSRKVLAGRPVDSMPMADQRPLPAWAVAIGNSRLLVSNDGAGFVIDAGYKPLAAKLDEMIAAGTLKTVEGIWITHYHDDHTDYAQAVSDRFRCPVYFESRLTDVLEHPSSYRLPCLTTSPITSGKAQKDSGRMRWHEFQFTFFDFPGQTLYHDGLLVERNGGGALFLAGDSFTPSGVDDYCLQNRDLLHEDQGYHYCLRVLERLPADTWLVNQHVEPTFHFSPDQYARMHAELTKRTRLIAELAPWPGPNYAIDESWAAIRPYFTSARTGDPKALELRIVNHSPRMETYHVRWNLPAGWRIIEADREITIPARKEGIARLFIATGGTGLQVVTADIGFGGRELREWTEAMFRLSRR